MVLLSFIPFAFFIMNAESNFKKSDIKKIAEKRRRAMDEQHGVDRDLMAKHYEELDKLYRVSEKEEIKKYLEIGKTPKQYYDDLEARGLYPGKDGEVTTEKQSSQSLRETLLAKEEDGLEISMIKGDDFEQVKVSTMAGKVPDPRVAGPSIYFDSRLDMPASSAQEDPVIMAMGDKSKKRVGSLQPDEAPAFLRPKSKD